MATFDDVIALTADLPAVTVGTNYGTPAVLVKKKAFCRLWSEREHHRDEVHDTEVLVLWGELEEKETILATHDVCFETPHYEGHGAFLVRMADVDLDELGDLLEGAYRCRAPESALGQLDGRLG